MENYADFLEHTDYEVGRVVDALEEMGELDNTLFIYILGDNGSSAEGGLDGTINEIVSLNGIAAADGGRRSTASTSSGCRARRRTTPSAGRGPVTRRSSGPSRSPRTSAARATAWSSPGRRITDAGGMRSQFHHVIDIVPTHPRGRRHRRADDVNGVAQKPIEGVSIAYTFDRANADAPSTRTHAVLRDARQPRDLPRRLDGLLPARPPAVGDVGLARRSTTIAGSSTTSTTTSARPTTWRRSSPRSCASSRICSWRRRRSYNVLPLDDRFAERMDVTLRPSFFTGRNTVTFYPGMVRLPEGSAPKTTTSITRSRRRWRSPRAAPRACSSRWAATRRAGRCSSEGKARYHYNWFDLERYDVVSPEPLKPGKHTIKVEFTPDSPHRAPPASVKLFVDDAPTARPASSGRCRCAAAPRRWTSGWTACRPVCPDYEKKGLFPFTGTIESVTFELRRRPPAHRARAAGHGDEDGLAVAVMTGPSARDVG